MASWRNKEPIVLANGCMLVGRTADYNSTQLQVGGSISLLALGAGIRILEGDNSKQGVATLVNGTVTVSNTSVTANSKPVIQRITDGGTVGASYSTTRNAGASLVITSKDGAGATQTLDSSTVFYHMFEPA